MLSNSITFIKFNVLEVCLIMSIEYAVIWDINLINISSKFDLHEIVTALVTNDIIKEYNFSYA